MTDTTVINIALQTMMVALKLSAPILLTSLVIGFTISLFQSMTQIQEFTLSFVPKLIGVGIALADLGRLDAADADRLHPRPVPAPALPAGLTVGTLTVAGEPLLAFLLASVRIIAWLSLVPPFAGRSVPVPAKVVLSLGLAFAVGPADGGVPATAAGLLLSATTQVFIGAAMGFVTYLLFAAIATAGSLVDTFGGFQLAQGFDPLAMNMNTVFGKFHQLLATMLLFATGGHLLVLGGLLKSFDVLPVGDLPDVAGAPDVLISAFGVFFVTAVQIALPLIAVLFVADLGLALLTKVAPHLNAINVMFPAKIGLTLLLLGLSFPVLIEAKTRLVDLANQAASALVGGG